jgi:hypothetical protein
MSQSSTLVQQALESAGPAPLSKVMVELWHLVDRLLSLHHHLKSQSRLKSQLPLQQFEPAKPPAKQQAQSHVHRLPQHHLAPRQL